MLVLKHLGTGVRIPPPPFVFNLKGKFRNSGNLAKMKKQIFLEVCCALLLSTSAFAKNCQSSHFTIHSDLDPCCVQFVRANAEAYYENLQERYFQTDWAKPLTIYYSKTQADTQQLLDKHGHEAKVDYGLYESSIPAVYTHQSMNNGELSGWGSLFHEITHHFIQLNYHNPPTWFDEGLTCFLGEQAQIVKSKLIVGRPSPWREQILRSKIEEGHRPNIKRLFSSSTEQFHDWDLGCHFARAFFYWLHETGQLEQYLKNVREKGYELSVLEETTSMSYGRINIGLSKFIKKNCYAGAYLKDGQQTEDEGQKEQAFLKALELEPDYQTARLELAECYYRSKDYEKCRENLKQIFDDLESIEYRRAAVLMANTYYNEKDYSKALEYYNKAWEYSDYYEYKYRVAYQIGNCFYHLQDPEGAKQWYKKFLDYRWEQESMKASADYARKYLGITAVTDANQVGVGSVDDSVSSENQQKTQVEQEQTPPSKPKTAEQIAEEERIAAEQKRIQEQEYQQKQAKLKADLDSFMATLNAAGIDKSIIDRVSAKDDELTIVVANSWHFQPYQIRLQAAQNLWSLWATIRSPNDPDKARIELTDYNGNSVGGSRWLAGSLIWVKKK
jgi:tetratricopeptide (TPR) repeat protein